MKKPIQYAHSLFPVLTFLLFFNNNTVNAQRNPILGAGNSYVNVSKRNTGGVVQSGDTLEIRTTYFFSSSYNSTNSNVLYKIRYYDNVPLKTAMLTGTNDSLRLITNEGLTFRRYTLAAADDAGIYTAVPAAGQFQVRINIGQHNLIAPGIPTAGTAGIITNTTGAGEVRIGSGNTRYKPQLFGGLLVTTAFRVRVTGAPGDTIVLGAGKLVYKKTNTGTDTVISATQYKILISDNNSSGLCGNALGTNLASENGGTFASGNTQNRAAGPVFPIANYDYRLLSRILPIGDGNYSFVNNLSPAGGTNFNARRQPNCNIPLGPIPVNDSCDKRMHGGHWDIIGDHTGTNNAAGNPAVTPGGNGGYMLVVNSDVVTSEAYKQNVTGLCPDTYYEFSAWIRNVCKTCGIDSNSVSRYNPGALPNLAFSINNLDIYSTGQLDTVGWQKKGFVFKTGPAQTTALIAIRNNAPGGGGNDWAIDDIALGTCGPSMNFNFRPLVLGCKDGTLVDLSDTIRYSYNPNYSWFKWQRSTDNGLTWGPPPIPTSGSVIPTLVKGVYQFVTNYPQFIAYGADSGTLYRVVVATQNANLNSSTCSFTDGNSIMLKMITCTPSLKSNLVSFTGRLTSNKKTVLKWTVASEDGLHSYEIEKSTDGLNFTRVGVSQARNATNLTEYFYHNDEFVEGNIYFRLKILTGNGLNKYSNVVMLSNNYGFAVNSVLNPFSTHISADIIMPVDGKVNVKLFDSYGKLMSDESRWLIKGLNKTSVGSWGHLASGMYIAVFEYNNIMVQKKLIKIQVL